MRLPRGGLELDGPLCQDPVWRSVADLDRRLQDASSVLRDVNVIHLEFDLMAAPPAVPVPGIFFELSREALQPPGRLLELAGQLCGGSLPGAVLGSLRRAVEALPARGRVIHLGAMRSRPGHGLRIVVGRVQSGLLFDYLTQAGWSGDRRTVEDGITALGGLFDTMLVSMDLGGTVRPRLGFECYIDPKPERFEQWRALLGRAVELGLCAPAKAPALLAWHGVCRQPEHLQSWPRHLRWGDRLLQDRATSVVARFLSHVKVVLRPDRPLELKGYYGFAHYWLEPSDPRGESSTRSWRIP